MLQSFAAALVHRGASGAVLCNSSSDAHVILIGIAPCQLGVASVHIFCTMHQVVGLGSDLEDWSFDAVIICKVLVELVIQVAHLLGSLKESFAFFHREKVFSLLIRHHLLNETI